MDDNIIKKIAEMEFKIKSLEESYSKLDKYVKDGDKGFEVYMDNHLREHAEILKMLWPAFAKTHPDVMDTLTHCNSLLGVAEKDDGSDPQP